MSDTDLQNENDALHDILQRIEDRCRTVGWQEAGHHCKHAEVMKSFIALIGGRGRVRHISNLRNRIARLTADLEAARGLTPQQIEAACASLMYDAPEVRSRSDAQVRQVVLNVLRAAGRRIP